VKDNKRLPLLAFFILIVIFFRAPLLKLQPYYGVDLFDHVPAKLWMAEQLKQLHLPLWNPYHSCGLPMAADDFTWGIYYPGMLFHILWPGFGFTLEALAHMLLSFYFFRRLLLYHGADETGILAGAVTFYLSAPLLTLFYSGDASILYAACWLPAIFYYASVYAREGNHATSLSIVLALQIFGGHPEIVFFTFAFCLAFLCFMSPRRISRAFMPFLLAAGIAAIHLLPVAEVFWSASMRNRYWTYQSAADQSFPLPFSFSFVTPFLFGRQADGTYWGPPFDYLLNKYLGVVPWILIVLAFVRWKELNRNLKFFLLAIPISLFITFGRESGYSQIADYIPLARSFSVPVNVMVFAAFFVSIVTALLWRDLFDRTNLRTVLALFAFSLAGLLLVYSNAFLFPDSLASVSRQTIQRVAFTQTAVRALILMVLFFLLLRARAPYLILAFHVACLLFFCGSWIQTTSLNSYISAEKWKILASDPGLYRVFEDLSVPMVDKPVVGQDLSNGVSDGIYFKIFQLQGGTTTLALQRYHEFKSFINQSSLPLPDKHFHLAGIDSPLLKYANVKYLIAAKPVHDSHWSSSGQTSLYYYKTDQYRPRIQFFSAYSVVTGDEQMLRAMAQADGLYFDHAPSLVSGSPDAPGKTDIVSYSPDELQIQSSSATQGYLYLSEIYFPGWHASVDGKKVPVERANYTFRAIPVAAGSHQIRMWYRPAWWVAGLCISLASIFLLTVIWIRQPATADIADSGQLA
jgi:hypothetical protein